MTVEDKASALHNQGFNCAQSVLCSCGAYTGLEEETALAVAGGFGGGLRCGEVCGAVSGAVMAVGLCCRYSDASDTQKKAQIAALARSLADSFQAEFGALRCADIKGTKANCLRYIEFMAALTEKTIHELENK